MVTAPTLLPRRVFLGWDRPCLSAAAEWLWETYPPGTSRDLGQCLVAFPGARAGRRLLELLVERAEHQQTPLVPPRIVTLGRLPEEVLEMPAREPPGLSRRLAWVEALRGLDPAQRAQLVAQLPADDEPLRWLALAEIFDRLRVELAGEGLTMGDVARRAAADPDFAEHARWQILSRLEAAYLAALHCAGDEDPQAARWNALEAGRFSHQGPIVLVGAVELGQIVRRILRARAADAAVLVFAPAARADDFDELGGLIVERWTEARIDLADEQIAVLDGPAEQAAAALAAVEGFAPQHASDEITLGLPDPRLEPALRQAFGQAGVALRSSLGTPVGETSVGRLLTLLAAYLASGELHDWLALVRHPEVDAWLLQRKPPAEPGEAAVDWLAVLDAYVQEHLPARVPTKWLGPPATAQRLAHFARQVAALLAGLPDEHRPLDAWAEPIADLLVELYGREPIDRGDPRQARTLAACLAVRDVLSEWQTLAGRLPRATAALALRLVLDELRGVVIPPEQRAGAIEMLGWLELPLDDAPVLIVAGMNEGCVPQAIRGDLFLPDRLRTCLGLADNDARWARDAYALASLAASRPALRVLAGRRSGEGDPLLPSRLLVACEPVEIARRTLAFQADAEGAQRPAPAAAAGTSRFTIPPLPTPIRALDRLHVTGFRDYLICPYRFYLRHVLNLESVAASPAELDAGGFGTLVHEVLRAFALGPGADATRPDDVREALEVELARIARQRFGDDPLEAVQVQIEQLRRRLAAFARWQAGHRRDGWKIEHAELEVRGQQAGLSVDGEPFYLTGRIDRVDRHEEDGRRIVYDYKTSKRADPERSHRRGGEWVDLQLPLYRHLASAHGIDEGDRLGLGYLVVSGDPATDCEALAPWNAHDLAEADRRACWVVQSIRAQQFGRAPAPDTRLFDDLAVICQDGQFSSQPAARTPEN